MSIHLGVFVGTAKARWFLINRDAGWGKRSCYDVNEMVVPYCSARSWLTYKTVPTKRVDLCSTAVLVRNTKFRASRIPTATLTASSSSFRSPETIGRASSQTPLWRDLEALNNARWTDVVSPDSIDSRSQYRDGPKKTASKEGGLASQCWMPTTAADSSFSEDLLEHCNRPRSQSGAKRCPPPTPKRQEGRVKTRA